MRQRVNHAIIMLFLGFILTGFQAARALPSEAADTVDTLRQAWAVAKYQTRKEDQLAALESLTNRAAALTEKHPEDPAVLAWQGTILSTYASVKGGLGALAYIDEARSVLEHALAVDERAEDALAHVILGAMYYRVPGWPVSFKSEKEARKHLQRALQIAPTSIDANYFYGDFLKQTGDNKEALVYLEAALKAPARPNQSIADAGRRSEVDKDISDITAQ